MIYILHTHTAGIEQMMQQMGGLGGMGGMSGLGGTSAPSKPGVDVRNIYIIYLVDSHIASLLFRILMKNQTVMTKRCQD